MYDHVISYEEGERLGWVTHVGVSFHGGIYI